METRTREGKRKKPRRKVRRGSPGEWKEERL